MMDVVTRSRTLSDISPIFILILGPPELTMSMKSSAFWDQVVTSRLSFWIFWFMRALGRWGVSGESDGCGDGQWSNDLRGRSKKDAKATMSD
jgi:hypothetical protein